MSADTLVFGDAASLVAASICELARSGTVRLGQLPPHGPLRTAVFERHRTRCGWCVYPRGLLARSIAAAYHWSELAHEWVVTDNGLGWSVDQLNGMPKAIARSLTTAVQALEDAPMFAPEPDAARRPNEPEPTPPTPAPPVQGATTDEPEWFAADFGGAA